MSALPENHGDLLAAAGWLQRRLEAAGLEVWGPPCLTAGQACFMAALPTLRASQRGCAESMGPVDVPPCCCHERLCLVWPLPSQQNVRILPTEGPRPVVYADFLHAPPGAPTALIYGGHSVAASHPVLPPCAPAAARLPAAVALLPQHRPPL